MLGVPGFEAFEVDGADAEVAAEGGGKRGRVGVTGRFADLDDGAMLVA